MTPYRRRSSSRSSAPGDLQRLLRTQIDVLGDDLYVLAEEFGDWEESSRRIDLLALDKEANLVVIELKRTKDGGHMELQAIRYASMISTMTLERAVEIHAAFLEQIDQMGAEAEARILEFLDWETKDDGSFAEDVRIVLVSEDFGKELTTAVLWLRDRDIDIRCLRLRPYKHDNKTFIDVQQIIPLPEAVEYQVQVREKAQDGETSHASALLDATGRNWWLWHAPKECGMALESRGRRIFSLQARASQACTTVMWWLRTALR